jgi:hypothetical protein
VKRTAAAWSDMTRNEKEREVAAQVGRATNSVCGEGAVIKKGF